MLATVANAMLERMAEDWGYALSKRRLDRLRENHDFHPNVGRRNCDAAVERSPALEALDDPGGLVLGDAFEAEPEPDRVEDAEILSNRICRVDLP